MRGSSAKSVLAIVVLSIHLSRPGTDSSTGEADTSSSSSVKTVADRHRLLFCWWWAIQWYQHQWPWTPKIVVLVNFSQFQAATHKEWIFA